MTQNVDVMLNLVPDLRLLGTQPGNQSAVPGVWPEHMQGRRGRGSRAISSRCRRQSTLLSSHQMEAQIRWRGPRGCPKCDLCPICALPCVSLLANVYLVFRRWMRADVQATWSFIFH
jgi:hypothetical protein